MKGFLSVERLKGLSDSVLLVALTILAYNLIPPNLVNGQADPTELDSFYDTLYGTVSSFFVIFVFWMLYMKILDHLTVPDDSNIDFVGILFIYTSNASVYSGTGTVRKCFSSSFSITTNDSY